MALLPAAVVLGLGLPFVGSALKIDDPLYLAAARHVLAHPLDPLGGASFWHDEPGRLFEDLYNPPLVAYVLAPAAALGGSERTVHLLMLGLAVAAVLALADVGRGLGAPPGLAVAVAASPALLACGVSAMTDVPFLLLTALAWGQAQRGRAARAGLLVGLSALTKYAGLLNLPLVALLLRDRRRTAIAAVPALGLFAAWWLASDALYGTPHPVAAARFLAFSPAGQAEYAASFVASLGLAGLPALVVLLRWDRATLAPALLTGVVAGAGLGLGGADAAATTLGVVAFGCGAALLAAAVRASRASARDAPFAAAAFWLYALWAGGLVYFATARYLLPLLGPLAWLLHRGGQLRPDARRVAAGLACAFALTLATLAADAGYAGAQREAARLLPAGGRLWQTGRWGFAAYAAARGHAALPPDEALAAGDVVAEPAGLHTAGPWPAQSARLAAAGEVRVPSPPLRVMDMAARAGFYSSAWGPLPLGWRPGAGEVVRLSRVPAWPDALLAEPPSGPVGLDVGSEDARHALLGGWSYDEAEEEPGGPSRTYAWALGRQASVRLPLPAGLERLILRASAHPAAAGALRIAVGPAAAAVVVVAPGWREYDVPVTGRVAGGPTTLTFRPAGHRRPGRLDPDRRESSVALDWIGTAPGAPGNCGAWPVPFAEGVPGILVTDAWLAWPAAGTSVRGSLRVAEGGAAISDGMSTLWSGDSTRCGEGCAFDLRVAPGSRLLLRADRARLRLE